MPVETVHGSSKSTSAQRLAHRGLVPEGAAQRLAHRGLVPEGALMLTADDYRRDPIAENAARILLRRSDDLGALHLHLCESMLRHEAELTHID